MKGIGDELVNLVKGQTFAAITACKVVSVDESKRLIDAEPINGDANFLDVSLGNGVVVIPKSGSIILIGAINSNKNFAMPIAFSEIDKVIVDESEIVVNGGTNGKMVILSKLEQEIQKLNNYLNAIKTAFNQFVPVPSDGGAALKTVMVSALASQQPADLSNVGNDKITH